MSRESKEIKLRYLRQPALVAALALIGAGNLVIPATDNAIIANYLFIALVFVLGALACQIPLVLLRSRFVPLVVLLAASYIPGFLVGPLNDYGLIKMLGMVIAIILLLAPTVFRDPARSVFLLLVFLGCISLAMCFTLLLAGVQGNVGRTQIQGLNPISTARATAFLPVLALSAVAYYGPRIRRWRVLLISATLLGLYATLVTGSRGPIVSALVAFIALLPVLYKAGKINGSLFGALAALGVTMTALVDRLSIPGLDRVVSADASGRDVLYSESFRIIADEPLGIGWGNLADVIYLPGQTDLGRLYSHNVFLEAGAEGGWFALLATLAVVVVALRSSYKHAINGHAGTPLIYAGLVFSLANAQFSSDIVGNRLLWLFLGLSLSVGAALRNKGQPQSIAMGKGRPFVTETVGPLLPPKRVPQ